MYYLWEDGKPVSAPITAITPDFDIEEPIMPGAGFKLNRQVGLDFLIVNDGTEVKISTVFLIVDHNYAGTGSPVLFETMVFWPGHKDDKSQFRYKTLEQAIYGHNDVVGIVWKHIQEQERKNT